ncbi:hypothetical protein ACLVWU_13385 [Bdellovibrio sp. HCB290]|uniref:hypothetical protein n=1 Tax=Bdellovibrio sp. HCB290 TaxID=3394356 RepID=UPI0039B6E2C5
MKLSILLVLLFVFSVPSHALVVKASVAQDVLEYYNKFLQGRDPLMIESFKEPGARRDIVELILFQQALLSGGLKARVEFVGSPSYTRTVMELKNGAILATGNTIWSQDAEGIHNIWSSPSTVRPGDFVAGLYGKPENIAKFKKLGIGKIKSLNVVTSSVWKSDYNALAEAGFKNIQDIQHWPLMVRMVGNGRADLMLSSFRSTEDLSFTDEDIKLVPLPGYKIELVGGRVWSFNKNFPESDQVIQAFKKGYKNLEERGTIRRAYKECGFFNERVKDWKFVGAGS